MGRLQDKVAVITGAGQGIGLAYAERFLAEGAKVVVAEIDESRAQHAMDRLDGSGDAVFVRTDIASEDSAQVCAAATRERFGKLEPEDIAGTAVFFASGDAELVTGQVLCVDGGSCMPA